MLTESNAIYFTDAAGNRYIHHPLTINGNYQALIYVSGLVPRSALLEILTSHFPHHSLCHGVAASAAAMAAQLVSSQQVYDHRKTMQHLFVCLAALV